MKKKFFWWVLALAWCVLIFTMSDKPAVESAEESMAITTNANRIIETILGAGKIEISDNFVRKTAHFTEYFILSFLLFKAYFNAEKLKKTFISATVTAVLYSVSDEIHQYFIPGRAMRFSDVLIDSAGIFAAAALLYIRAKK